MAVEPETGEEMKKLGSYGEKVRLLKEDDESAAEEIMLLWEIQQPTPNSFQLRFDAGGPALSILQSPSSLNTPGVTGSMIWDTVVILAKFLEHVFESGSFVILSKKVGELGSGCGLFPEEWPAFVMSRCFTFSQLLGNEDIKADSITLNIQRLGEFVTAYGFLANGSSELYHLSLSEHRFQRVIQLLLANFPKKIGSSRSCFRTEIFYLLGLSRMNFVLPLCMHLYNKNGLTLPPCFMWLPGDLKLRILYRKSCE